MRFSVRRQLAQQHDLFLTDGGDHAIDDRRWRRPSCARAAVPVGSNAAHTIHAMSGLSARRSVRLILQEISILCPASGLVV